MIPTATAEVTTGRQNAALKKLTPGTLEFTRTARNNPMIMTPITYKTENSKVFETTCRKDGLEKASRKFSMPM